MGVKLTVNLNALNRVKLKLKQLGKHPVPLEEIGRYLVSETNLRFLTGTDPSGKKWHPIKRHGQILVNHGHLRNSITYNVTSKTALEIGSNLVYAAIHQLGGRTGKNHRTVIIARPYLGINNNDQREIVNIITDSWKTLVNK